jgi:serralysin
MHIPSGTVFKRFFGDTGSDFKEDTIIGPNYVQFDYKPGAWADYTIDGKAGDDTLVGGYGDDEIFGDIGNDTIAGGYGINDLFGEGGIDTLDYSIFGTHLSSSFEKIGNQGVSVDMVTGRARNLDVDLKVDDLFSGFENVNGSNYNDIIDGNGGANRLNGYGGADDIDGGAGRDRIDGGSGNDKLYGDSGNDTITGFTGQDKIYGESGADALYGEDNADDIYGGSSNDYINAGQGADYVNGGSGNDRIYGSSGGDDLKGGTGRDTFVYKSIADSTTATSGRDFITDFNRIDSVTSYDKIDLSKIDANELTSFTNERFKFVGDGFNSRDFNGSAGEIIFVRGTDTTTIYGDTDGDKFADFAIDVQFAEGVSHNLYKSDFVL